MLPLPWGAAAYPAPEYACEAGNPRRGARWQRRHRPRYRVNFDVFADEVAYGLREKIVHRTDGEEFARAGTGQRSSDDRARRLPGARGQRRLWPDHRPRAQAGPATAVAPGDRHPLQDNLEEGLKDLDLDRELASTAAARAGSYWPGFGGGSDLYGLAKPSFDDIAALRRSKAPLYHALDQGPR